MGLRAAASGVTRALPDNPKHMDLRIHKCVSAYLHTGLFDKKTHKRTTKIFGAGPSGSV